MAEKIHKTNAIRLLDKAKLDYSLLSYIVDESDLSEINVEHHLGQNVKQEFKTLILKGDK